MVAYVLIFGGFSLVLALALRVIKENRDWAKDVEKTFIDTAVECEEKRFYLDRRNAILVKDFPRYKEDGLQISRIYKNSFGEYFYYVGTDKSCMYFSHISRQRAQKALIGFSTAYKREFGDEAIPK